MEGGSSEFIRSSVIIFYLAFSELLFKGADPMRPNGISVNVLNSFNLIHLFHSFSSLVLFVSENNPPKYGFELIKGDICINPTMTFLIYNRSSCVEK